MAKEEPLAFPGVVSEALPNAMFRVQLEDDREIVADIGETLRKGRVLLAVGDRVMVEMTAYDLIRGRILLRVR